MIYGSSTGRAPIQVKRITVTINLQKAIFFIGINLFLLNFFSKAKGTKKRITIEKAKAKTPPNLLGIDRRMA